MNKFFRTYSQGGNNFYYFLYGASQFSSAERWTAWQCLSFSFCKRQAQRELSSIYRTIGRMRRHPEAVRNALGEREFRPTTLGYLIFKGPRVLTACKLLSDQVSVLTAAQRQQVNFQMQHLSHMFRKINPEQIKIWLYSANTEKTKTVVSLVLTF